MMFAYLFGKAKEAKKEYKISVGKVDAQTLQKLFDNYEYALIQLSKQSNFPEKKLERLLK
jgi:hypothetical protein